MCVSTVTANHGTAFSKKVAKLYVPVVTLSAQDKVIDRGNLFDQSIKNNLRTYNNIKKSCNKSRLWLHNCLFAGL